MPPKSAFHKNPRPTFKPPRPIGAPSSERPSTIKAPISKASRPAPKPPRPTSGRGGTALTVPSDSEEDDAATLGDGHSDDERSTGHVDKAMTVGAKFQEQDAIPPKLIARLLHEHFRHDDTRITKEAMSLFVKYVEIFAREAVARALNERREAAEHGLTTGPGMDFLEVDDLEKLTPQLLLDF